MYNVNIMGYTYRKCENCGECEISEDFAGCMCCNETSGDCELNKICLQCVETEEFKKNRLYIYDTYFILCDKEIKTDYSDNDLDDILELFPKYYRFIIDKETYIIKD